MKDAVKSKRSSFTLVELLLVIAIIIILAGMLFPVLSRGRGAAKSAVCKALLKQYALATECYANDYMEVYPDARRYLDKSTMFLSYFGGARASGAQDIARCPGDGTTETLGRLGSITLENYDSCIVSIGACENTLSDSARPTSVGPKAFWRKRGEINKLKNSNVAFGFRTFVKKPIFTCG